MSTLGSRLDALATKSATRVTRTRWFRRAVSRAFRAVDHDESGALTLKEANGAVGCLYVEIAKRLGKRVSMPSAEDIERTLAEADANADGQLSELEFYNLCVVLCQRLPAQLAGSLLRSVALLPAALLLFRRTARAVSPAGAALAALPDVVLLTMARTAWNQAQDVMPELEKLDF